MNRQLLAATVVACCTAALSWQPALAIDNDDALDMVATPIRIALQTTGAVAGVTLGSGISLLRTTPATIVERSRSFAEESSRGRGASPADYIVTFVPAVTVGLPEGLVQGTSFGMFNGFYHGIEKPFSAESFSLHEDYKSLF